MKKEEAAGKIIQHFNNMSPKLKEIIFKHVMFISKEFQGVIAEEFNAEKVTKFLAAKKATVDEALIYIETVKLVMGNLLANILLANNKLGHLYSKQEILDEVDFFAGDILNTMNQKIYEEINSKEKFKT